MKVKPCFPPYDIQVKKTPTYENENTQKCKKHEVHGHVHRPFFNTIGQGARILNLPGYMLTSSGFDFLKV